MSALAPKMAGTFFLVGLWCVVDREISKCMMLVATFVVFTCLAVDDDDDDDDSFV